MKTRQWRAVAELAASQHGVTTRAQAAAHGVTADHLRVMMGHGTVDEPLPTVIRIAGSPSTWRQRVTIVCLAFEAVASHRTAAALHTMDGLAEGTCIEVSLPQGRQRHDDVVIFHRARDLDLCDVTLVDGIPTTSVARTLCDLGAVVGRDCVERALDDALRRGVSPRWIEETLHRVDRPGPSGTGTLRHLLTSPERTGVIPDSWRERVTQRLLRHPELRGLVPQYKILGPDGGVLARPDFALPEILLGIEYHSDQWHYGPRRGNRDRRRDRRVGRVGWYLMYLDATDHRDPASALDDVLDTVRSRRQLFGRTGA
jgi:hypothetical protein